MLFTVIRHDHPDSLALRRSARPKHLKYLKQMLDKIMYGGALLDNKGNQIGSLLIIKVANQAEAEAFADADPFVEVNLFATTSVQEFRPVFLDGTWIAGGPT